MSKGSFKKVIEYIFKNDFRDWNNRRYDFYLLFCDNVNGAPPWDKNIWNKKVEPLIDALISKSPEYKNTGIKAVKYQNQNEYYKDIRLGRLRWDEQSHNKWTTHNEPDIHFQKFEMWTPIWTKSEKTGSPPDVFIHIENEQNFDKERILQFDTFIVIAIANDLKINCTDIIVDISKNINSKKTVFNIRRWSKGKSDKDKNWKFNNWISDTFTNGIYNETTMHNFDFNNIAWEPYWKVIFDK